MDETLHTRFRDAGHPPGAGQLKLYGPKRAVVSALGW
jgi:hypothetical protein